MPFGALQTIAILFGCWAASKLRLKSAILAALMVLVSTRRKQTTCKLSADCQVIIGCTMIYVEGTGDNFKASVALGGYYLMAFLFGGNPLIVSWIVANTAGQTKKSVISKPALHLPTARLVLTMQWLSSTPPVPQATLSVPSSSWPKINPITFPVSEPSSSSSACSSDLSVFRLSCSGYSTSRGKGSESPLANPNISTIHPWSPSTRLMGRTRLEQVSVLMVSCLVIEKRGSADDVALDDMTDVKNNEFVYVY